MMVKRSGAKVLFLALVAVLLLSLPLAVGAETTNGITNPKDGSTVSGSVEVKGNADHSSFMKWQLDLLPGGNSDAAIFLAFGEKAGEFSYTLDTAGLPNGEHALRLRVVRADSNYDEYVNKFTIANAAAESAAPAAAVEAPAAAPAATEEPVAAPISAVAVDKMANGISAPKDGATVTGVVEIKGYADDASFMKWQLDLLPGGNSDAAIFLALGEKAGEFSYTLDTAGLPNGEHAFRLRVVRADSNYDEYVTKFTIANK